MPVRFWRGAPLFFEKKLNLILSITLACSFGGLKADDHVISYGMEGYQCNYKEGVNKKNFDFSLITKKIF